MKSSVSASLATGYHGEEQRASGAASRQGPAVKLSSPKGWQGSARRDPSSPLL